MTQGNLFAQRSLFAPAPLAPELAPSAAVHREEDGYAVAIRDGESWFECARFATAPEAAQWVADNQSKYLSGVLRVLRLPYGRLLQHQPSVQTQSRVSIEGEEERV